jgi:hypothetical protein
MSPPVFVFGEVGAINSVFDDLERSASEKATQA